MLTSPPVLASNFGVGFWLSMGLPVVVLLLALMSLITAILLTVPKCCLMARHFGVFIVLAYLAGVLTCWPFRDELDFISSPEFRLGSSGPLLIAFWCIGVSIWLVRSAHCGHRPAQRFLKRALPWSGVAVFIIFVAYFFHTTA
jgi:hypothetical protein